ncbi:MAG: IPTL-CTERM sorting domain-containing protein [Burkholderiales bacterium]|nr:IPTL-CTERM sorting domain-containing protein [Burkholderiales bacterium]
MKPLLLRAREARTLFFLLAVLAIAAPAHAARVGILSNKYASETAAIFAVNIPGHTFTAVDTAAAVPALNSLTTSFDVLLVFEDSTYGNAPAVGNVVAAFAQAGKAVALGAFYDQDRSDAPASVFPHGWGALEQLDPNTTDGVGTPYAPRTLDTATMQRHPLTTGIAALASAKFAGGNSAKAGTTVVAYWNQPNAKGEKDPALAYRITDEACVIQFAIAPNYPVIASAGTDFSGDFYRAWSNVFDFAAARCAPAAAFDPGGNPANVPTLSQWSLLLTVLLVGALAFGPLRRR